MEASQAGDLPAVDDWLELGLKSSPHKQVQSVGLLVWQTEHPGALAKQPSPCEAQHRVRRASVHLCIKEVSQMETANRLTAGVELCDCLGVYERPSCVKASAWQGQHSSPDIEVLSEGLKHPGPGDRPNAAVGVTAFDSHLMCAFLMPGVVKLEPLSLFPVSPIQPPPR